LIDDAGDLVVEASTGGTDLVQSKIDYTLADNVEKLTLIGPAAISGTGNGRGNLITGNGADNVLRGVGGADVIAGESGSDDIYGGAGHDKLTGGTGTDDFFFDTALNVSTNVDKIIDFSAAADSIKLSLSVFEGITAAGTLATNAFRLGTAAGDADDRIIYDSATGNIFYDADGSGAGAKVLFAKVTAGTTLTRSDFIAVADSTTSRTTSDRKDSSFESEASDVFSFDAETLVPGGEFFEPARMLDQEQWSQMRHISVDYFSS
jgi:Ca2+-binding RTX toxin-like protein